jgi:hypothetical protein
VEDRYYLLLKKQNVSVVIGSIVVKALRYKPEDRRWRPDEVNDFFFSIYLILPAALGPGVHSACNRNEYQKEKNFSG